MCSYEILHEIQSGNDGDLDTTIRQGKTTLFFRVSGQGTSRDSQESSWVTFLLYWGNCVQISYEKSKDPKLDEIQKYLSFELKPTNKLLYKSNSDTKFENRVTPRITSQRQETLFQNGLINRQQQKALHSKINQINSWRQQPKIKNSGFYKKLQNSSRLNLRTGLKRT